MTTSYRISANTPVSAVEEVPYLINVLKAALENFDFKKMICFQMKDITFGIIKTVHTTNTV